MGRPQRLTYGQWRRRLGPVVELEDLPEALGINRKAAAKAIGMGELTFHSFRAVDGRVFRVVTKREVDRYRLTRRPLSIDSMRDALARMVRSQTPTTAGHRNEERDRPAA